MCKDLPPCSKGFATTDWVHQGSLSNEAGRQPLLLDSPAAAMAPAVARAHSDLATYLAELTVNL